MRAATDTQRRNPESPAGRRVPGRGEPVGARRRPPRAALVGVLLAVAALALVAGGLWAALAMSGADGAGAGRPAGDVLELEGGALAVTDVAPEVLQHGPAAMPGAMMPDPVPDGFRRVVVDVVLTADSSSGLTYDAEQFRLGAAGTTPVAAQREGLGAGVVPEGARLDGELVFVVPEAATELTLTAAGVEDGVVVRVPAAASGGGHGEGHPADPEQPGGG